MFIGGDSGYSFPLLNISTDLGATWTHSHAGLAGSVYAIAPAPGSSATFYCGTSSGLYKSTDAGGNWVRKGTLTAVRAVCVDGADTDIIYAGTNTGVYVTTDGGTTWSPFNAGLTNTDVMSLALRSGPEGMLFAGTNGGALYATAPLVGVGESRRLTAGTSQPAIEPNPCRGGAQVRLHLPVGQVAGLSIYDRSGRMVREVGLGTGGAAINTRGLAAGAYFVRVATTRQTAFVPLVVVR